MFYSKEIPQKYDVDVFVAGGGPSGVAAAVTCARQGKRVFLAEAGGAFGGSGTLGMVPELMNFDDGEHFLAGGIGAEVCRNLFGFLPEQRRCMCVQVEEVKRLYDRMVTEAGVDFTFFTRLIDVVCDADGHVAAAICVAKSGIFAVKAKTFLDCTGDGDLAVMAGAEFEMGRAGDGITMPGTLCSYWAGVDFQRKEGHWDGEALEEAFTKGIFTQEDRLLPGLKKVNEKLGLAGGNIGHLFSVDATDERSLTEAMQIGRKILPEYERYYRTYIPGCDEATCCLSADFPGIRESRRICGEYRMEIEDFLNRATFADEIGRYSYPVDIHLEAPDKKSQEEFNRNIAIRHGTGESYGIPYRALIPKKLSNVLVAGRCISADRAMQASVRVIPGCYITGQAAGMAAALSPDGETRSVDVRTLQQKLLSVGGYLPNAEQS